jgi:hypothetical protein
VANKTNSQISEQTQEEKKNQD